MSLVGEVRPHSRNSIPCPHLQGGWVGWAFQPAVARFSALAGPASHELLQSLVVPYRAGSISCRTDCEMVAFVVARFKEAPKCNADTYSCFSGKVMVYYMKS